MGKERLVHKGFINPMWFNRIKGKRLNCIVKNGRVDFDGVELELTKDSQLEEGAEVEVWLYDYFYCQLKEEIETLRDQAKRRSQEQLEKDKIIGNERRDKAIKFNDSLNIPVKWAPAIKDVLSGLTENSWGDGRRRSTVQHIKLLEPIQEGRLKRAAGDFLCCGSKTGKQWSCYPEERFVDGEGKFYPAPVTCKQCIKMAKRWERR